MLSHYVYLTSVPEAPVDNTHIITSIEFCKQATHQKEY